MRVLNAMRFISEPEDQKYAHTPVSRVLLGNSNPVKATLEMLQVYLKGLDSSTDIETLKRR
jgi:hypothetical protein